MIPPKPSSTEFHFDEAAADRAVRFFEICLIHTKGEWAGQPLKLSDWQAEKIIRPLFGWKRKDGTRRYRTAYIQIPRKAGKSTLSAGIALYLLFADKEPGAEIYSAAADRDQAAVGAGGHGRPAPRSGRVAIDGAALHLELGRPSVALGVDDEGGCNAEARSPALVDELEGAGHEPEPRRFGDVQLVADDRFFGGVAEDHVVLHAIAGVPLHQVGPRRPRAGEGGERARASARHVPRFGEAERHRHAAQRIGHPRRSAAPRPLLKSGSLRFRAGRPGPHGSWFI